MSIDLATDVVHHFADAPHHTERTNCQDVKLSYDGSNVVYRLLRLETWGPALLNLGFYRFGAPWAFLNRLTNMEVAQRRLVMKSIDLLDIERNDRVLDVACGRGKSSFIVTCLHPETTVVGIDLLERNVQVARTLFDRNHNLTYMNGNAMSLDFPEGSFDRVMCIEAAFHFPDRARFIREAYRVLRPGGRLVVVDFAWKTDAERVHLDDPETRLVRQIWQWDDMFSISDYTSAARDSGFRIHSSVDWSRGVTYPVQDQFQFVSMLGNTAWGRRLLEWHNPLYKSLSNDDWRDLALAVRAHHHVTERTRYMAFVFDKPTGQG